MVLCLCLGFETFVRRLPYLQCQTGVGSEFGEVSGSVDCPYGKINIHWKQENIANRTGLQLQIRVPFGTKAHVQLPEDVSEVSCTRLDGKSRMCQSMIELEHGEYILLATSPGNLDLGGREADNSAASDGV